MAADHPAALIAMDIATAIHAGALSPGQRLPSQTELMRAYGVAMATAASALRKLRTHGLTHTLPGRGVVVAEFQHSDVATLYRVGEVCRGLAATTFPPGRAPLMGVDQFHDHETSETIQRPIDMSALVALDRAVLRALGDSFVSTARRAVGYGLADADQHLLAAARAILRDGGRRPEDQPPIAVFGGASTDDDQYARRLWPHHRADESSDDGPPF
ncbi:winged helix-turn-helix domain-containing protein [Micromonospora aurantiaca (nom. illeg.)]|uniref:winged helix-turn-helix domain-containing protein n=1 Tax=Micromonospora aurantiaca (nom. illeg.) TaxID=47850 RepID=UPI0033CA1C16